MERRRYTGRERARRWLLRLAIVAWAVLVLVLALSMPVQAGLC